MASYRVHLATSTVLGAAYGTAAVWSWHMDWGPALLGAGLTALGGITPDLDSDSGIPVRELFSLAAATVPVLLFQRLLENGLTIEQTLVVLAGIYLFIRYGLASVFKHATVHRGMFHSIPAMLIAGLAVFLLHHSPDMRTRFYLAGGIMMGFFSHLLLDEIYAVNFMGLKFRLNKYAGSAIKLWSPSWSAVVITYLILIALAGLAWLEVSAEGLPHNLAGNVGETRGHVVQ